MAKLTEKNAPDVADRLVAALSSKEPTKVLSDMFMRLQDRNLDSMTLFHYVNRIYVQFVELRLQFKSEPAGLHPYQKQAVDAGLVKMLLNIAVDTRTDHFHGMASFYALHSTWGLLRAGTMTERRELMREMLDNQILQICIDKIHHPLIIHRFVALTVLRSLAGESFLGQTLSSIEMSSLLTKLCQHILSGHEELYSKQLEAVETSWQGFICIGKSLPPPEQARKHGPRYFALSQERAAYAIQSLLSTSPAREQNFYVQIMQNNPELVSLMLKCAALPRPPWYPDSEVGHLVASSLTLLIRVPRGHVPGLSIPVEDRVSLWITGEWMVLQQSVPEFLEKKGTFDLLMEVWRTVEDESAEDVMRMLAGAIKNYAADEPRPDEDDICLLFAYRGHIRTSVERIIATIISAGEELPMSDLLSCLSVTHKALRRKLPIDEIKTAVDKCYYFETEKECFRPLMYLCACPDDNLQIEMHIADEPTIGPTAHARVLALLIRRGALDNITRDAASFPKGTWYKRITIAALREMISPCALRSFAALGRQRVTERKDEGARRFKEENDLRYTFGAYNSCAELAAALIDFDNATKGAYSSELAGVRRDLVLCLGNAAQMMIQMGRLHRGQCFARAAVKYVEDLPEHGGPDAVSVEIREKNKRRLATCMTVSKSFDESFLKRTL